jgi:hypothetical protein
MEMFLREDPTMRQDSAQATLLLDVNKSLPPLPLPEGFGEEEEELH